MSSAKQFRTALPILQTAVALFFGGWGLWLRNSLLNHPFLNSTLWSSTARYHVWPWPFKFAAILNMPAFLIGSVLSLPIAALKPRSPEWVECLPCLFLVPVMWYLIGFWLDRWQNGRVDTNKRAHWPWLLLVLVTVVSAIGGGTSRQFFSSYVGFLYFGVLLWIALGVGMRLSGRYRSGARGQR